MEELICAPQRIFINNIDSYASKWIAKLLSECAVGTPGSAERVRYHVVGSASAGNDVYVPQNRDELLSKLMGCDVIIYNITQHADQVEQALWAVSALQNEMDNFSRPKMFILVSTVMTWARSKQVDPDDPEIPFTDELFFMRKPHPNFKQHFDLEKTVFKLGKINKSLFSTYVVASGLQYGMGEFVFHFFFKTSWLGQDEVPVFGNGNNIVPMIHIHDLARVIQPVIERQPKPRYILAVDNSNNTMDDIVKTIAIELGPGKIQKKAVADAFFTLDLSGIEIDSIQVDLRMEAVHVKELFSMNWLCESGLVENIKLVVEEYRQTRKLLPIRVCVLGPPGVGKSTFSKRICDHYKLHHVTLEDTISEAIAQLEDAIDDQDAEKEEALKLLYSLKESTEENRGLLVDKLLVNVVKDKLMSNPCQNQGFVLDSYPKTSEQAKELFCEHESDDDDDGTSMIASSNKSITPEFVLSLDASDDFLKDQVMNLPERLVQVEQFLQQLAMYREITSEEETVFHYFNKWDVNLVHLEITSNDETDRLLLMQKIFDTLGQPRNYGPSIEEEERMNTEERISKESQDNTEQLRGAAEATHGAAGWTESNKGFEASNEQEKYLLNTQSIPMRNYLLEHVIPTLSQGLIECCGVRPEDPIDFLVEYLVWNNPCRNFLK